jgi:exopolysaccharide biosynthesis protein
VQIAINSAFFDPFYVNHLFDYAPRSGEATNILGLSISNGNIVSNDYLDWAVFCANGKQLSINPKGCPINTQQAISGRPLLIQHGKLTTYLQQRSYNRSPQPRTAIALSKDKQKVWLIVVDGRQTNYSGGVNLRELSDFLLRLGTDSALNLDGGGSSTRKKEAVLVLQQCRFDEYSES